MQFKGMHPIMVGKALQQELEAAPGKEGEQEVELESRSSRLALRDPLTRLCLLKDCTIFPKQAECSNETATGNISHQTTALSYSYKAAY